MGTVNVDLLEWSANPFAIAGMVCLAIAALSFVAIIACLTFEFYTLGDIPPAALVSGLLLGLLLTLGSWMYVDGVNTNRVSTAMREQAGLVVGDVDASNIASVGVGKVNSYSVVTIDFTVKRCDIVRVDNHSIMYSCRKG